MDKSNRQVSDIEIVIVGAGLIGSSVAMHLAAQGITDVAVLDVDLEGSYSSSELNAGGVRVTWNHPLNVLLSKNSIDYFETVADEIGFRQRGYFWMYAKEKWEAAAAKLRTYSELKNAPIDFLSANQVHERHPFIDKIDDIGGATLSKKDGLLNPNLLKLHYRANAKKSGIEFLDRHWVEGASISKDSIVLKVRKFSELSDNNLKQVLLESNSPTGKSVEIKCKKLINCSGAWADRFAKMLGTKSNSHAVRRQVSIFECRDIDITKSGMFVDPSGVYFHPEANHILGGFAIENEPPGYNLNSDGADFFQTHIWPALFARSSKFENLKYVTGWAGLYEVSPDRSPIIGTVGGFKNVFEAHSFSGRGVMQSYATGLALAELIVRGRYETLDLAALNGERFTQGKLVTEGLLI